MWPPFDEPTHRIFRHPFLYWLLINHLGIPREFNHAARVELADDMAGSTQVELPQDIRVALLFGSERYGLATEDLQYCNVLVRIPANPDYCSLNLGMSVQLLAYEYFMAREQPGSHTQLELPLAPSADVEHFYAHLQQVMHEIDFDDRSGHLMERLRRLFNRAQLDRNEVNILRGLLSAVQGRRGQSTRRSGQ